MKNSYACPHCRTVLNPSVKILLVVRYRSRKGMILLSPQPGNFKFICDKTVRSALKPGAKVTFACPVCAADLTSPADDQFAELLLVGPDQTPRRVEFSRVFGTHATFILDGDEVQAFGEAADDTDPTNFFGA